MVKNHRLKQLLVSKGLDTDDVWEQIEKDKGKVGNIQGLTDEEKKVFKTFSEIDPQWIIELASIRQKEICQSQSVNIKVRKDISLQEMSDIHMLAWTKGLKTLYYCRAEKANETRVDSVHSQPLNRVNVDINFTECLSCQG